MTNLVAVKPLTENLFFQDWSIHYNQEEPVAPRYEINAPDLYIPGELRMTSLSTQYIIAFMSDYFDDTISTTGFWILVLEKLHFCPGVKKVLVCSSSTYLKAVVLLITNNITYFASCMDL